MQYHKNNKLLGRNVYLVIIFQALPTENLRANNIFGLLCRGLMPSVVFIFAILNNDTENAHYPNIVQPSIFIYLFFNKLGIHYISPSTSVSVDVGYFLTYRLNK